MEPILITIIIVTIFITIIAFAVFITLLFYFCCVRYSVSVLLQGRRVKN